MLVFFSGLGYPNSIMNFLDIIKILLLWPFSLLYWLIVEMRTFGYKNGLIRSHKASIPVISIGNIAAGGTGKTPMAIYIAQLLMDKGRQVAVLSRGYKRKTTLRQCSGQESSHRCSGVPLLRQKRKINPLVVSDGLSVLCLADEAGDEPFLMASRLLGTKEKPGALVIVGKDRVAGAEKAVELGAQVIILDDGFQHLRLKRDLDIVLLDNQKPYDNGWLLPAGMLRESKSALRRSEVIALTRCGAEKQKAESRRQKINPSAEFTLRITEGLRARMQNAKCTIFETRHKTGQPYGFGDRSTPGREALKNSRVLLFSGIARPESFEQSVRQAGLSFTTHLKYPDHHHYSQDQLKQIAGKAQGCDYLLTTEKDAVKLPPDTDLGKPLFVLPVEIEFLDEAQQQRFERIVLDKVKIK